MSTFINEHNNELNQEKVNSNKDIPTRIVESTRDVVQAGIDLISGQNSGEKIADQQQESVQYPQHFGDAYKHDQEGLDEGQDKGLARRFVDGTKEALGFGKEKIVAAYDATKEKIQHLKSGPRNEAQHRRIDSMESGNADFSETSDGPQLQGKDFKDLSEFPLHNQQVREIPMHPGRFEQDQMIHQRADQIPLQTVPVRDLQQPFNQASEIPLQQRMQNEQFRDLHRQMEGFGIEEPAKRVDPQLNQTAEDPVQFQNLRGPTVDQLWRQQQGPIEHQEHFREPVDQIKGLSHEDWQKQSLPVQKH